MFLISILVLGNAGYSLSQEMTNQDYLELSEKQKKTGLILIGGGAAFMVTGAILFSENFCLGDCGGSADTMSTIGAIMVAVGGVAVIVGIPTLINSGTTAKKASQLSLSNQQLYFPTNANQMPKSYPVVTWKIPLGKGH